MDRWDHCENWVIQLNVLTVFSVSVGNYQGCTYKSTLMDFATLLTIEKLNPRQPHSLLFTKWIIFFTLIVKNALTQQSFKFKDYSSQHTFSPHWKKTVLWSQIIKEKKQKTNTFDVYYFSPQNISYCKEIPCNQQQAHNNVGIILCILYFSKFKYFLIIILIL